MSFDLRWMSDLPNPGIEPVSLGLGPGDTNLLPSQSPKISSNIKCNMISMDEEGLTCFAKLMVVRFSSAAQCCPTLCNPTDSARQASLSITNSWSPPRLTSIESVMPSRHLVLRRPLLLSEQRSTRGAGSSFTCSVSSGIHQFGARVSMRGEASPLSKRLTPFVVSQGRTEGSGAFSNYQSRKQAEKSLSPNS